MAEQETPGGPNDMNRRCVCVCMSVCVLITSVHYAAQSLRGVSLRQSQAEVTQRIRDTLHGPDDPCSGGGQRRVGVRTRLEDYNSFTDGL